ncbi:MFS general substrate transporter [Polychaeton citri CBS 116435]|uniref:Autophagy-related protein n=1 Tax=Polychaeton citri CBS 116435 TaxID=1314669 RepID=A0A9P4PWF0_9PEZI|nr:MFS general substrate transporter [Polychaeton citri CBS 116435]
MVPRNEPFRRQNLLQPAPPPPPPPQLSPSPSPTPPTAATPPLLKHQRSPSPFSVTTSAEADDERSTSSESPLMLPVRRWRDNSSDGEPPDDNGGLAPANYPGEDTRPTSRKEILGFYTYSFAGEVFVVCGLGAFIPITLEELARASATAVLARDHTKSCQSRPDDIPDFGGPFPSSNNTVTVAEKARDNQCVFTLLGSEINTASFAMFTFSLSVLLQALVVVTISGAADHGRYRKTFLLGFGFVGAVTTMLFLPVTPNVFLFGSLWAILGNICFGASFVLLNSFLPLLVRHHPQVGSRSRSLDEYDEARSEGTSHPPSRPELDDDDDDMLDSTSHLLRPDDSTTPFPASPSASSPQMQLSTKISSNGVGIGYIAAVIVQILSVIIVINTTPNLWALRIVLFIVGLWWFLFTIPAALWLRPRPGPPLALTHNSSAADSHKPNSANSPLSWTVYLTYSWKNLFTTILRARRLKDVLLFLAAWFMISDAIATVSGTAILFAKTTLAMPPSALAMINVIVTLCGIFGAFSWSTISRYFRLSPSATITTCICIFELIPIYGLLGFLGPIQRLGYLGLQQQWEMYPVAAVYGIVLGGLSSYCRSLYGELIPPGSEAAFYALYAITDKGSSIFGPAVVGAITNRYGDIRPAFWFLAVLIGLPIPIMYFVDVERGRREGRALARQDIGIVEAVASDG